MSISDKNNPLNCGAIIAFATRWGSQFGGINSFNADLLPALRLICPGDTRIVCVVLDNEPTDKQTPSNSIEVISLHRPNDPVFLPSFLPNTLEALANARLDLDSSAIWIGHDRITGEIAIQAAAETGGRSALIHHMSYADYEAYAETAQEADEKEQEQRSLFKRADFVMAIGPTLRDALSDMLGASDIPMIIPGLPELSPAPVPNTFTGFLSGRINNQTNRIKQAHLGIAGFAKAVQRANNEATLPDVLKAACNPTLKVRGLSVDRQLREANVDAEQELKRFAEDYAGRVINLRALPFTVKREDLFDELRRSSLALMPSWHEGFGLVAWEAIAAGVPVVLSKRSGVYRLLQECDGGVYTALVHPIDVRGASNAPYFRDEDLREVSDAVIQIAKSPQQARANAAQLRETLLSKGFTWQECAHQVLKALSLSPQGAGLQILAPSAAKALSPSPSQKEESGGQDLLDPLAIPNRKWTRDRGLSISQLLRAEEEIVPFDPKRVPFLHQQITWAETEEFPISVRLLTGEGGAGKTRLALELCRLLRERGWWAGFLRDSKGSTSQIQAVLTRLREAPERSLVVIDYAETRITDLLCLIKPLSTHAPAQPLRVLLLARGGGDWWDRLEAADPMCESLFAGRATSGPFSVPPLYDEVPDRESAFRSALRLFAATLGKAVPDQMPSLAAEYYAQPLLIQMAALMALHGEHAQSAEGLIRGLVNHERRYWAHLFEGSLSKADQAAQLMCLSTLSNGLQVPRPIESIWTRAGCGTAAELKYVFNELKQLYPGKTGLEGLRPDLLGEALVTQVILSGNGASILDGVMSSPDQRIRQHSWTVISRIMRHRADVMPLAEAAMVTHYANNARDAARVCCQTPSPLPQIMESGFDALPNNIKLQVAGILDDALENDTLPLNELALRVSETRLEQARRRVSRGRPSIGDRGDLAKALSNTSVDLGRCGHPERALALVTEAQSLYEELARVAPARFKPNWAGSLNNYANDLSDNGLIEEAEGAARKALALCRDLVKINPLIHEPNLAMSLQTYAITVNSSGRIEESVALGQEAVNLYRKLAIRDESRFEPQLGLALNNHAAFLSESGRVVAGLDVASEALEIHARLGNSIPERFEQDWASSLTTFASRLSENGFSERALGASQQALALYDRLAMSKPQRFGHVRAAALNNCAIFLSENGQVSAALEASKEALDIFERLARSAPERFEPLWATALGNFGSRLEENGQIEEAIACTRQALNIRARLCERKPELYEPDLAISCTNYAVYLNCVGKYPDALDAVTRALDINRRLAEKLPRVHTVRIQQASILARLIMWLDGSSLPVAYPMIESQNDDENSGREWAGVLFFCSVVDACVEANALRRLHSANQALVQWHALDPAMQRNWESLFFVAAALDATNPKPPSVSSQWELRYSAFVKQRRGHLPVWLQTASARLGFVFPVVI